MFSFVGKMMGVAIRGGHVLNLDLPSIVWKPLVGQELTREDLQAIDSLCFDVCVASWHPMRAVLTPPSTGSREGVQHRDRKRH